MVAAVPRKSSAFDSIENVSWLELFYDLVMVAAIIVFSHGLSAEPTCQTALKTVVIFSVLWWVWLITTLLVNADPSTNTVRRGLMFAQMLTMVLLIIVGSHTEIPWRDPLAPIVGVLLFIVAVFHEVTRRTNPALSGFAVPRRNAFLAAAILATVSGFLPHRISGFLWIVTGILMVGPVVFGRFDRGVERPANNLEHLADRLAALTTIVIGESFIRVALTGSGRHLYEINFTIVCLEFFVVCSIWIAYFDDFAVARMPATPRRRRGDAAAAALVADRASPAPHRHHRSGGRSRGLFHAAPEQRPDRRRHLVVDGPPHAGLHRVRGARRRLVALRPSSRCSGCDSAPPS
jgi:low temperature requirement protein LtrA